MTKVSDTDAELVLEQQTHSTEETMSAAKNFGTCLRSGDVVLLSGPIGAGKTYFAKGLAAGMDVSDVAEVNSPTYDLVHTFFGRLLLYHIDLYRIDQISEDEIDWILEYLDRQGVCMIEWGEKIQELLTRPYYHVELSFSGDENSRRIHITRKSRQSEC